MLKASALYLVIVIALVIAVLCSSVIVVGYIYRLQYQQKFRADQLHNNLGSGINLLLAAEGAGDAKETTISLFGGDNDSVSLKHIVWGAYDIGVAKAFIQRDTVYQAFTMAQPIDSTQWAALYLIDEDRPLSVSGKTLIKGDAYLPKSGIREAYIDGKAYQGDKRIVLGNKHNSNRTLPPLNSQRLQQLDRHFTQARFNDNLLLRKDSVFNSFLNPTRTVDFKKSVETLADISLSGNIILYSDTLLIIDGSSALSNVIVFAKSISVKQGFHGNCQLFARDSISVESNCTFNYPSCLGIIRFETPMAGMPAKIHIGENSKVGGILFTYEKEKKEVLPMIELAKNSVITGQVYASGMLNYKEGVQINGSVYTSRFVYQTAYTRYENYLVGTRIDATALSPYYLTSGLMQNATKPNKVLQWLEAK